MERCVWGLDIGGTKCALVSGNMRGEVLFRREVATAGRTWRALIEDLLREPPKERPLAVGVSCGGPLDARRGLILSPPNLPGWDRIAICDELTKRFGGRAFLMNDANACALAEWMFGAGRGTRSMVFLTFGTGFGAGLILDGRLYAGANDMAGEIGHVRCADDGPLGYGKAGSFEGFCSGGGISQLSGGLSAREVAERADRGEAEALRVLNISAEKLGLCLSLLIDLLNPEKIVVGSIYARALRHFEAKAAQVIAREALPLSRAVCRVVPAKLGDAIGDIAALTVAWNGLRALS